MNGRRGVPKRSSRDTDGTSISRRAALAATAGLTVSTSGCLQRLRNLVTRDNIDQLSLTIVTLPAESDRACIRIANELEQAFTAAGIDVSLDVRSGIDFHRTVLYNHDFDICISRHPGGTDPDYLYQALYSRYADESGWQNPFGYTNLAVDDLLEKQRRAEGDERRDAVTSALEAIAVEQPFVPICVPEEHRSVRTDRFTGWSENHLATRRGYLGLEPSAGVETLRATHTDARPTENLNPLAVDYRGRGTITELLYDSLATDDPTGAVHPWLAKSWEWDGATIDIRLRDGCEFHDGTSITASDIEFTYEFLKDMSLGDGDIDSPAPRFRGQVESVETVDARRRNRVEITVGTNRAVGERALLVPILPEHVWRDRAADARGPGAVSIAQGTTRAVVTNNMEPVGSGPFRLVDRTEGEQLTFERFDSHFTLDRRVDLPSPTVDEFSVGIAPSSKTAVQAVENDDADVTLSALETNLIDGVSRSDSGRLVESPSWTFYFLGFNARNAPFSNPRFRRVLAQLVDKEWIVEEVFHGNARPVATPVIDEWVPESLEWDGNDPETPFLGTDGEVNANAVQLAFEDAGFRYDEQDRLRVRQ
ncbi:ABC transporter substrate-binding protein [Natrinema sp. CBA1119]|uniref:ABC transporter substrate-binding protein n=1 Tax=Natrinema sp. CBA1119 TaxID=1608465 RepID=UPI000BF4E0E8|nr:ABC transporter substrate-binding protein [Natrinema sp. CBA1119]PGF14952.1 ABC transporter substrate-binding protein [Natrinema sp. CBA1119]